jgi:photosystem II stability/assembly factor-like uncharacterized protein
MAKRRPRRRVTKGVVVASVAALAVVVAVGVAIARRDAGPKALSPMPGDDPGVVHVHGLGIDPADGTLFAATHLGLFRIPENGTATRVANRYQDTMGFTVVGPHDFLGSGHPDLDEDTGKNVPPLLGLIESTDAGETWKRLSLLGEADFHGLQYAHGTVYGYDSTNGRFMVSTDRKHWETRSTGQLVAFAVSPADADVILATTPNGLQRSTDGGRTWTPAPSPTVQLLHWADPTHLWALSPSGQVLLSADGGTTFDVKGNLPGPPEAITADGDRLYAAVQRNGIFTSTDGGKTWTVRYRDPS